MRLPPEYPGSQGSKSGADGPRGPRPTPSDEERWFAWQVGYAAFGVSPSQKKIVLDYIANQEEHHRKISFKEEFISFLKKHEIEYDEKYLWE